MARTGRPKKELNWDIIEALCAVDTTLDYIAEVQCRKWGEDANKKTIKAAREVIERRIRQVWGETFTEYKYKRLEDRRINLRRKQYDMAMGGNVVMLIWLGKQMLGQKQDVETPTAAKQEFTVEQVTYKTEWGKSVEPSDSKDTKES